MVRVVIVSRSLLWFVLLMSFTAIGHEKTYSKDLQKRFTDTLYRLPLEHQGEYALMLYRTTGDKNYLETARVALYLSADRLQRFYKHQKHPQARQEQVAREVFSLPPEVIESYRDYLFYSFMVLPDLSRIDQFAMSLKGDAGDKLNQAMNAFDFKPGLTSVELISVYGPQLAKQAYALLELDYGDYRATFIDAFRQGYPDSADSQLSQDQLLNKWQTMAQLIIAASDQLQEPVSDGLLNWVTEYFLKNEKTVLEKSDSETLAKIGLALHLTGHGDSVLAEKIRSTLRLMNPEQLAYNSAFWVMLLLDWQESYYPDPAIYRMSRFKNKVPFSLKPQE